MLKSYIIAFLKSETRLTIHFNNGDKITVNRFVEEEGDYLHVLRFSSGTDFGDTYHTYVFDVKNVAYVENSSKNP